MKIKQKILLCLWLCCWSVPGWSQPLEVLIEGVDLELADHVRAYLSIARENEREELPPGRMQRLHTQAPAQIKTAMQAYGYYKAEVESELQQYSEGWQAIYRIHPGDPVRVSILDIRILGEGESDEKLQEYLKKFPLQKDQPLEHARYELGREMLLRIAAERGFLEAVMQTHQVKVDMRNYSATVELHLQTGKRFYFGAVTFHQDALDQNFLSRYVRFKEDEPYSPSALLKLQTSLSDSGYFQRVEVRPNQEQLQHNKVPIDVDLESRKPRAWRFGLGYATDTGPRTTVSHTRLIGNEGDKFQSDLLVSEKLRRISAAYTIPMFDPTSEQLAFGARFSNEITDARESYITGLSTSYTTVWHDWIRTLSLNREREVYVVGELPEETRQILYPALILSRVRADDRLYTRHGSRVYIEFRGANENILSDTNFGQARVGLKWIRGIGADGRVILRGDLGTTNVAYLDRLPASQRFFAGGDNSVRGYAYEELGPKNDAGEVIGGKHLMVGSVELEHRFTDKWSVAAFYDAGNAINSFSDKLARGSGAGLRWNSPVGPVRFDFAWALNKTEDRFRLHIVIGPDL